LANNILSRGRIIFFVTGNIHKFNESRKILAAHGTSVAMLRIKTAEIQDDNLESIAKTCALEAFKKSNLPLIVEDAGLFIRALKGFPGPYSSYVYRTIGNEGVLKLLKGINDRYAKFQSAVVFCGPGTAPTCFHGVSEGEIATEARGSLGFGFDPVFKPIEDGDRTFGEMSIMEKSVFSHRSHALRKFAEWYNSDVKQSF